MTELERALVNIMGDTTYFLVADGKMVKVNLTTIDSAYVNTLTSRLMLEAGVRVARWRVEPVTALKTRLILWFE